MASGATHALDVAEGGGGCYLVGEGWGGRWRGGRGGEGGGGGGGGGREVEGGAEEAALHLLVCGALWKHQQRRVAVAQREIAVCGGEPDARVGGTAHAHHVSQHGVAASGTSVT